MVFEVGNEGLDRSHAARGNASLDALRPLFECDAERHWLHPHAGAWERSKLEGFKSTLNNTHGVRVFRQYPLGDDVVAFPVRLLQCIDGHRLAAAWRMDEAVIAQVDGHVVDLVALDVEEDQIAWLEVLTVDFLSVTAGH